MSPRTGTLLSLLILSAGCGSQARTFSLDVGGDDAGDLPLSALDGSVQALDAYVESKGVAVTVVTLSCSGACATVQAIGTGGYPPYTFHWSDGVTSSTRSLCPSSTTQYSVAVTDTGSTSEVVRRPQTANAAVTADVITCPEAGVPEAGPGVSNCQPVLTVTPPSGTISGAGTQSCTSGSTQTQSSFSATASLKKGASYTIKQDITGMVLAGTASWNLYGSAGPCLSPPGGQLLGTLTFDPNATTNSFCFTADGDYSAIDWTFTSVAAGFGQGVYSLCNGCAN